MPERGMTMKYELNQKQINNLKIFLNRVEYKGLVEALAVTEIVTLLNSKEEKE